MPLTKITLLGELSQFGSEHEYDIGSPAEAVRMLCVNYPDFAPMVRAMSDQGVGYQVLVAGVDIGEEELGHPIGAGKDLVIVPVIEGSGAIGKIIGGIALLGLGLSGVGLFGLAAGKTALLGAVLALGGVSSLLTPKQKARNPNENKNVSGFSFSGAVNTDSQANVVPLVYGRFLCGSHVLSAGITSYAIAP
jgi:predicted phage tail protein